MHRPRAVRRSRAILIWQLKSCWTRSDPTHPCEHISSVMIEISCRLYSLFWNESPPGLRL